MKLSIIIPALNEEKLLPKLLAQLNEAELRSQFDYELIVADGGSEDATVAIAVQSADTVVVQPDRKTRNISSGRNLGAKYASGEVLIFFNADVLLEDPVALFNYITTRFHHSPSIAMSCAVQTCPEEADYRDTIFHGFYNLYFFLINRLGVGMGRGECHIIKAEAFRLSGGYRTDLPAGEDFDLFRRLKKKGSIDFVYTLRIFESPRRYRKYGYFNVARSWTLNAFSIIAKNKSDSQTWEEVR